MRDGRPFQNAKGASRTAISATGNARRGRAMSFACEGSSRRTRSTSTARVHFRLRSSLGSTRRGRCGVALLYVRPVSPRDVDAGRMGPPQSAVGYRLCAANVKTMRRERFRIRRYTSTGRYLQVIIGVRSVGRRSVCASLSWSSALHGSVLIPPLAWSAPVPPRIGEGA